MTDPSQLSLFPLPPPGPRSPAPLLLPRSLQDLLDEGIPGEVVTALVRELGGRVISVPAPGALCEGHLIVRALGLEAATALARSLGGPSARFSVPRGAAIERAVRDAAIRRDSDAGIPAGELVRRYRLTERAIWAILGRA